MRKIIYLVLTLLMTVVSSVPAYAAPPTSLINIQFGGTALYTNGAAINDATQTWNQFYAPTSLLASLNGYNTVPTTAKLT